MRGTSKIQLVAEAGRANQDSGMSFFHKDMCCGLLCSLACDMPLGALHHRQQSSRTFSWFRFAWNEASDCSGSMGNGIESNKNCWAA